MQSSNSAPAQAMSPKDEVEPFQVISATSGWAALNLKQIWNYRDLLFTLAGRDIKLRYRQTALGVVWVVLQPLIAALIFTFVFGTVGKFPSDGLPYIVFSYAGLLAWNLFSATLTKSSTALIQNSNLISKVFFPRLILPISTIFSNLIDFGVALVVIFALMITYRINPGINIIFLPVLVFLILLLSIGMGLFTSALTVSYRDVQFVLPVATQMLLYASPIAYSVAKVPEHLRQYFFLNPLTSLLEAFRWSLLGRGEMHWGYLAYSGFVCIAVFIAGAFSFKKMERKFADVI